MKPRVIVTRPAADSEALAARLTAAGFDVVIAPMMSIEILSGVALPTGRPQAIALTSANGMRGLMAQRGAARLKDVPVIAVGDASARAATEAGFSDVAVSGGDVRALTQSIVEYCKAAEGAVLYPSGVHISGDLEGALTDLGYSVNRLVVYQAVHAERMPDAAIHALDGGAETAVVLYSPRSALIWSTLLARQRIGDEVAGTITHLCLSRNVEAALLRECGNDVQTVVAAKPDESAMIDSLEAWRA